jgi:glycosyltransferase involved in cell wall biosynthesis
MHQHYNHAGFYDLRLKLSQSHTIFHLPEFLYTETETDNRKSGEKQFDYVNPRNREVQIEMEQACTEFLKETNALLEPDFREINFDSVPFCTEISVVIPVKNRVNTIADAVQSVLSQQTTFPFNLIVVDNHSSDGTSEVISKYSSDNRLLHLLPSQSDLGIGGCWNEAISHEACGKFAVQLDSDDIYIDDHVLEKIHAAFYEQQCAMVVGSYKMVNFALQELPPGIIDHREWTPDNGRNNALRINGLGAPRAFYTPVLRNILFPNVSYGEDYAVGLNISRYYRIGRIFEPLYLCRRWEGNSDAALDIHKLNTYNYYKDKIRTLEYLARQQFNLKI